MQTTLNHIRFVNSFFFFFFFLGGGGAGVQDGLTYYITNGWGGWGVVSKETGATSMGRRHEYLLLNNARTTCTNNNIVKPDLRVDQDKQC